MSIETIKGGWTHTGHYIYDADDREVAEVHAADNTPVMCAAPEMLEFIKKQRSKMQCVCKLNAIVADLGAGIECTTCIMDALIAKADGRE